MPNLSPQAQKKIEDILELLAYISEAVIFLFLGISVGNWEFDKFTLVWAPCLVIIMICVRLTCVFVLWPIVNCITPIKAKTHFKDIFLVAMCGNIRGAISFALIIILKDDDSLVSPRLISTIQLTV